MAFAAKFKSSCGECDGRIKPGDQVEYNLVNELVHTFCPEGPEVAPVSRKGLCPECHLELPASGVCGVC